MAEMQTATTAQTEDFSAKALRNEQKKLAAIREQMAAEKKQVDEMKAEYESAMARFKALAQELKSRPMEVLQRVGWTDEKLAEHISSQQNPVLAPQLKKQVKDEDPNRLFTKDEVQNLVISTLAKERLHSYLRDVDTLLDDGSRDWAVQYEPDAIRKSALEIHAKFMKDAGRPPSAQEAVDMLENGLVEQVKNLVSSKRISGMVKENPEFTALFGVQQEKAPVDKAPQEPAAEEAGDPDVALPVGGLEEVNDGIYKKGSPEYWITKFHNMQHEDDEPAAAIEGAAIIIDESSAGEKGAE